VIKRVIGLAIAFSKVNLSKVNVSKLVVDRRLRRWVFLHEAGEGLLLPASRC
jgi:hypothetical protein